MEGATGYKPVPQRGRNIVSAAETTTGSANDLVRPLTTYVSKTGVLTCRYLTGLSSYR